MENRKPVNVSSPSLQEHERMVSEMQRDKTKRREYERRKNELHREWLQLRVDSYEQIIEDYALQNPVKYNAVPRTPDGQVQPSKKEILAENLETLRLELAEWDRSLTNTNNATSRNEEVPLHEEGQEGSEDAGQENGQESQN